VILMQLMTPASVPSEYEVEVGHMFELMVMVRVGALVEVPQAEDLKLCEPWG
jgi:hypothetical protein